MMVERSGYAMQIAQSAAFARDDGMDAFIQREKWERSLPLRPKQQQNRSDRSQMEPGGGGLPGLIGEGHVMIARSKVPSIPKDFPEPKNFLMSPASAVCPRQRKDGGVALDTASIGRQIGPV